MVISFPFKFSKFAAKLVNLYLTTFRYDEWEKFAQELQEMDVAVQNFTETLSSVDRRVQVMRQFQQLSRGLESRDYNLLEANLSYVSSWSIVQCTVVVLCGVLQVICETNIGISRKTPLNNLNNNFRLKKSGLLCPLPVCRQPDGHEVWPDPSQGLGAGWKTRTMEFPANPHSRNQNYSLYETVDKSTLQFYLYPLSISPVVDLKLCWNFIAKHPPNASSF